MDLVSDKFFSSTEINLPVYIKNQIGFCKMLLLSYVVKTLL
jgi:hypothetical protein